MEYNLFLDDFRIPEDCFKYTRQSIYIDAEWVVVRNYDEFVKTILEKGIPEIISFDHDLADEHYSLLDHVWDLNYDLMTEKTGYHCAKWLIEHCIDNKIDIPKFILIHSMNVAGSQNIESLFNTYRKIYGR